MMAIEYEYMLARWHMLDEVHRYSLMHSQFLFSRVHRGTQDLWS
jgi:hypothetical protein